MNTLQRKVRAGLLLCVLLALVMPALLVGGGTARADTYFPQTGYSIWGPFETYWQTNGGLAQFGLPRTGVYHAGNNYDAQWFERALFTWNPNNANAYKVQLDLLGNEITASRRNEAPFVTAKPGTDGQYFAQTGHNLSGKFLEYWQETGGLPIYGYPISEPFMEQSKSDGNTYLVQYFERNRFELHPELAGTKFEVQLGLLGSELLDAQGGPAAIAAMPAPASYPIATAGGGVHVPPGTIVTSPGAGTPEPTNNTIPTAPPLPATRQPVLFMSDFSSPDLSAWTPFAAYTPPYATPASWSVTQGVLAQSGIAEEEGASTDALLLTNDTKFGDATIDVSFYPGGEAAGVVARYGPDGYYLFKVYAAAPNAAPKAVLLKISNTQSETVLASSTAWPGFAPKTWYDLTLTALGSTLTASIDGVQLMQVTATQLTSGRLGMYAFADGMSKFDNFRVTGP